MIDKAKVIEIAEGFLSDSEELFLVDVTISPSNEISVTIDSDTNVDVDTCVALSRAIEQEFDREQEDFELTVSSAGIGQSLTMPRQIAKLHGKEVEVLLKTGIKLKALLVNNDDSSITIRYSEKVAVEGKKRKQLVETERTIEIDQTKSIKEIISFK